MLSVYEVWIRAPPRRAAGFYASPPDAISPGFCFEDLDYSEDVMNWDAPRVRSRGPVSSSKVLVRMDLSDDESLDSMDSSHVKRIDWWLRPSMADRVWLEDMRQWQASSAAGDYDYEAPWEDQICSPMLEVCDP